MIRASVLSALVLCQWTKTRLNIVKHSICVRIILTKRKSLEVGEMLGAFAFFFGWLLGGRE